METFIPSLQILSFLLRLKRPLVTLQHTSLGNSDDLWRCRKDSKGEGGGGRELAGRKGEEWEGGKDEGEREGIGKKIREKGRKEDRELKVRY